MSRSKKVRRYPGQLMEIAEKLGDDPTLRFVMPCEDMKAVRRFMLTVHSFISAGEKEELNQMYPELSAMYCMVQKEPLAVVILHRDYSPEALMMQEALNAMKIKD